MIYPINKEEIVSIIKQEFHSDLIDSPFQKIYGYKDSTLCAFMVLDILYERMELSYIYVDSRKRHQGIASLLMDFMLKEALNNQVEVISLEVSKENKAAIALYEKYGFQIAAKREGYYQGIDALLMTKDVK